MAGLFPKAPGSFLQALSCLGAQETHRGLETVLEGAALSIKIWGWGGRNGILLVLPATPALSMAHWGDSSEETGSGPPIHSGGAFSSTLGSPPSLGHPEATDAPGHGDRIPLALVSS